MGYFRVIKQHAAAQKQKSLSFLSLCSIHEGVESLYAKPLGTFRYCWCDSPREGGELTSLLE